MKRIVGLIFFFFTMLNLFAQDSTGKAGIADVAEDDPALFYLMMLILISVVVAIAIGLAIAAIICLVLFILTAAGIISISVFMGWYHKSFKAGLKWLSLLSFGLVGAGGGAFGYFAYNHFSATSFEWHRLLLYALPAGLAGGLLCGWLFFFILLKMARFLQNRYKELPMSKNQ